MRFSSALLLISLSLSTSPVVIGSSSAPASNSGRGLYQDIKISWRSIIDHHRRRTRSKRLSSTIGSDSKQLQKRGVGADQCILVSPKLAAAGVNEGGTVQSSSASSVSSSTRSASGSSSTQSSSSSSSSSSTTKKGGSSSTSSSAAATSTASSPWKLSTSASGSNFFQNWNFWDQADPTYGYVQYLSSGDAESNDLISIKGGEAILAVETTQSVTGPRKSVRIQLPVAMNGGLLILDASHMPAGCGTWPAFWTVGPNWPNAGEIDILEGINDNVYNQAALHTAPGCTVNNDFGGSGVLATGNNCDATINGNTGCGIRDTRTNSYGAGFNSNGGGVYAMVWDDKGVRIFFFPRGTTPDDIDDGVPNPESWGTPTAFWPSSTCNPYQFNKDHDIIINTTLCGQWASSAWASAGNGGGQSCAQSTGFATCEDFVRSNGGGFTEAYWSIKSVKLYKYSS